MIGDGRAFDAPPVDSLAEAIVLSKMVYRPELIDHVDIGQYLVFDAHRLIWQALTNTRTRFRDVTAGEFYLRWCDALESLKPGKGQYLVDLVLCAADEESARAFEEVMRKPHHEEGCLNLSEYFHGFNWWVARLKRIHDSRKLISAAQAIAERAWREDVDEARAVASSIATRPSAPPVWERDVVH